jgi:hypothetical protein
MIRRRLTYANVTATLALVFAIGGGAYAATELGPNTVGTRQLKDSSVTKEKLRKNAVTTEKIANEAISEAKLRVDSVGAFALKDAVVRSKDVPLLDGGNAAPEADCNSGEVAIAGGGRTTGTGNDVVMEASEPTDGTGGGGPVPDGKPFAGWQAWFHNAPGGLGTLGATAYVVCIPQ